MPAAKKTRTSLPAAQHSAPNTVKDTSGWALKKLDGEMFTRADIQYDLMSNIFNDRTFQFTSPLDQRAISFKELYVETLSRFSKAAKSTVRQLDENPNWATNFCIASFLINIGRINTTVAFYPELRAYMRTYHPIPCLQKDEYCQTNLQDAPRIKTMLKSCQLPSEYNDEPDSLPEIAKRSAMGYRPPTTVVNLIFELFGVEPYVSMKYFPEGFVLHDLFSPTTIPTKLRAYAFLWLMHHFLEDPSAITDFQHEAKIEAFQLARLEDIQPNSTIGDSPENVDTEEELQWGKDMQSYRLEFLKKWRGEEGIGFVDDLAPNTSIAALAEDAHLTKKQKIMVQNYAQSTLEVDAAQAAHDQGAMRLPGPSAPPTTAGVVASKSESRKGAGKDTGAQNKTVSKARLTHVEKLQSSLHAMVKYGEDGDLDGPEDLLEPIQLAWRRYQNDVSQDVDVAYDSDDPSCSILPGWKPKELKQRLLGFAFPMTTINGGEVMEEEKKDKVIRYVGVKKRAQSSMNENDNNANNMTRKGSLAGNEGVTANSVAGASTTVKVKRKRRVNPPAPTAQPSLNPTVQPQDIDPDHHHHHPTWYHSNHPQQAAPLPVD